MSLAEKQTKLIFLRNGNPREFDLGPASTYRLLNRTLSEVKPEDHSIIIVDMTGCDKQTHAERLSLLEAHKSRLIVLLNRSQVSQVLSDLPSRAADFILEPLTTAKIDSAFKRLQKRQENPDGAEQLLMERITALIDAFDQHLQLADRQLTALTEVAHQFAQIQSEDELLQIIPKCLCQSLGFDRSTLLKIDGDEIELVAWCLEKDSAELIENFVKRLREQTEPMPPVLMEAFTENKTIFLPDLNTDPRWPRPDPSQPIRTKAIVTAPIRIANQPVYLLVGNMQHHEREMDESDVKRFETYVGIASLALEKNRTHQLQESKIAERTKSLNLVNADLEEKAAELEKKSINLGNANVQLLKTQEELEQKNRQIEQSKEEIQAIFDSSPDAILMVNQDGHIAQFNRGAYEFFGLSPESLHQMEWDDYLKQISGCFKDFQQFIDTTEEIRVLTEDCHEAEKLDMQEFLKRGVEIHQPSFRIVVPIPSPVVNRKGEMLGHIWIFNDITRTRRADDLLRTIVEVAPMPIFVSRLENEEIIFANDALADVLQIPCANLIGKSSASFYMHTEDHQTLMTELENSGKIRNF